MEKELVFITVIGKDRKGIVATISGFLYKENINIVDINQRIMSDGYFVMTMLVDIKDAAITMDKISQALEKIGDLESGAFNLGNGDGYSVLEVTQAAARVTGTRVQTQSGPRRAGDPAVLVASSARARSKLGWQPRFPGLEEIITSAWKWTRTHPGGNASQ